MRDDLAVGLGGEFGTLGFKLSAQLAEILDDAIVYHREFFGRVRMRVLLGRAAMGGPARVADADRSGQRLAPKPLLKISEFALRPAAASASHARAWLRLLNRNRDIRGA